MIAEELKVAHYILLDQLKDMDEVQFFMDSSISWLR